MHTPGPYTETTYGGIQRKDIGVKSEILAYKVGIGWEMDQNGDSKSDLYII